jgi:3-deoxy-D-manno-octulosonic-acid transferase
MYLFYSTSLLIALLLAGPYFFYQAYRYQKYWGSLAARLGYGLNFSLSSPCLLVHCVSVGEFLAAEPLLERLQAELPQYQLIISTTTATGQALAQKRAGQFAQICYFPLDFQFAVRRFLAATQPTAIIIVETELWPNFLHVAAQQHRPVIIVNGRISPRSFRRYRWVQPLLPKILANVASFLMQTAEDAARIRALGAPPSKVQVVGNIKYDLGSPAQLTRLDNIAAQLAQLLQLPRTQPVLVVGSTTDGEEAIVLAAYRQLCATPALANTLLILAPRHPERFETVANLLHQQEFSFVRRSKLKFVDSKLRDLSATDLNSGDSNSIEQQFPESPKSPEPKPSSALTVVELNSWEREPDKPETGKLATPDLKLDYSDRVKAEVILCDTIGELAALYRYADVVLVGGSLLPHGGHNILEPALYGRAVITGAHTNNFSKILADFRAAQAVVQLPPLVDQELSTALAEHWRQLLLNPVARKTLGDNAQQVMCANRGAVARHLACIATTLCAPSAQLTKAQSLIPPPEQP